jgi:hypothetical protein
MNKPLPQVVCKSCNKLQAYRAQETCIHCGNRFSNWHIAGQLERHGELVSQLPSYPVDLR